MFMIVEIAAILFIGFLALAVLAAIFSDDPASATGVMKEGQRW